MKKKNRPEVMSRANINKLFSKFLVLTLAYLMEEPEFENHPERLVDMYDKLGIWLGSVQDHELTIQKVITIIEQHTGGRVYF